MQNILDFGCGKEGFLTITMFNTRNLLTRRVVLSFFGVPNDGAAHSDLTFGEKYQFLPILLSRLSLASLVVLVCCGA